MDETKKPLRKRRLKNLNDCVRAGAWLFNGLARDEIEPTKASKLAYLLNIQKGILQVIENLAIEREQLTTLAERLEKIEKRLNI